MSALRRSATFRNWFAPEAVPIYITVGAAVSGAAWYVSRLARGPDVVWDRKGNPAPWLHVEQDTNTKMYAHSRKFEKSWSRDRL